MRFYLDEDISPELARRLRETGVDVTCSQECQRNGCNDEGQLEFAAQEGRCLVTRNRNDFIRWTLTFFHSQRAHAGVLIIPHTIPNDQFPRLVAALKAYAEHHPEGVSPYTTDFLKDASRY